MEYQGQVAIGAGQPLPTPDNETALAASDDHLARFIEALAHHSSVCRKLHLEEAASATSANGGKKSG